MAFNNQIIDINNDKYLIRKAMGKLVLHHLPSLDIVYKYYSQVDYFCVNKHEVMLLSKNVLTFLKPKCPPLRLIEYQQEYLDWKPMGGLSLADMLILYDKSTIAFYYRYPKLERSWATDVAQEIEQARSSGNEKFIAFKVKQPKNTILVWDMGNISKKTNQQITLKQKITKWSFYGKNILLIMTQSQLNVYFVNQKTNTHFIQYFIPLHKKYTSFFTLNNFYQTQINTGRKSVNTIAFLNEHSCNFQIVELYDIQKRQRLFKYSALKPLVFDQLAKIVFSQVIAGYQYQGKILILGEVDTGIKSFQPKCLVLNKNFKLQKVTQYKQHQGTQIQNIQSINDYVLFLDKRSGKYKVGKFVSHDDSKNLRGASDKILYFSEYPESQLQNAILTKKYVLLFNKQKKLAILSLQQLQKDTFQYNSKKPLQLITDFSKYNPKSSFYIFQNTSGIFFVCGVRQFKYDFQRKQIVNTGFVIKNEKAKLQEVRIATFSLTYKINTQFILIEYSTPSKEGQKVVYKTIKSSQDDKIISLRKNRWARVNMKDIVFGEGQTQLATFNMQKMYKTLLQQDRYFQYDLYWTTHEGMILAVKNYLFFLQIIYNQNGYQIRLIKKGHSYLHRRFSSSSCKERVKVIDPRNLVIYTGNRIAKLSSQVENYITDSPYILADTLLSHQLKMREYYPPHHPSTMSAMLQNGWFAQIAQIMQKLQKWLKCTQPTIKSLYEMLTLQDFHQWQQQPIDHHLNTNQQKQDLDQVIVMAKSEPRNQAKDIQLINSICQEIITCPDKFKLTENSPLILENLLKAVVFKLENSRALDYFSQTVIARTRILKNKNEPFTMMDVAFLAHSINKDQAVQFLKSPDHKIQWSWVQKYSVVLWYWQSVQKWKKWVQQIAMTQFRAQKDAFDCLFWYILANKKNILVTLFNTQKFSSKQHEAMHNFLQRDFQDPKHKSAALKNAYALIDKKRYMHAMAFFLLADKKQQCVRFAIDRLHDLNLAFLIHLLCNGSDQTNWVSKNMVERGDIWAKHIGWVIQKKHIASYNVLFKDQSSHSWEYSPQLKGFHPAVIQFSHRIKQTIPYKRQSESRHMQTNMCQTINTFNFNENMIKDNSNQKPAQPKNLQRETQKRQPDFYQQNLYLFDELPLEQQNGFKRSLREKGIRYYMRHHLPVLALRLKSHEEEDRHLQSDAKRAYQLEKYVLAGQLSESIVEIAEGLDDIVSLLKNDFKLQNHQNLRVHLTDFRQRFECLLKTIKINELNPPSKHQIGELLHYSYFSQRILIQIEPVVKNLRVFEDQLTILSKTNNFGKIMAGVSLKIYSQMGKNLEAYRDKRFVPATEQFWVAAQKKYDMLLQKKKQKHLKLMDTFELSLNNHIKKFKDQDHFDFSIRMPKSSTMSILLWRKIFQFLAGCDQYLKQKVVQLKVRLDKIVTYWVERDYLSQIQNQIGLLIGLGTQYRLKLNVLSAQFQEKQLDTIEQLLKLVYTSRELAQLQEGNKGACNNEGGYTSGSYQNSEQRNAVQIFRNTKDHLKGYILDKNSGKGIQIVTLFRKTMRKFLVQESLSNRDRSKDGISLIHQDNVYTADMPEVKSEGQIFLSTSLQMIFQTFKNVFSSSDLEKPGEVVQKSDQDQNPTADYLRPSQSASNLNYQQISAIQTHSSLPIFFLGGKGVIQICRFDTLENYNRIICPQMQQIVKIQSVGQRLYTLDKQGNLSCHMFDYKQNGKVVFEVNNQEVIDFVCPNPSVIAFITPNSFQVYDTLLPQKYQRVLRIQMSNSPVAISCLSAFQVVILRKLQVQIYDINTQKLVQTLKVNGRGRCLHVDRFNQLNNNGTIFVGRQDCKIKIFNLDNKAQTIVKVGSISEQKQQIYIQSIQSFGSSYFCFRNDGSIYHFNY